jgi:hypothetical protein
MIGARVGIYGQGGTPPFAFGNCLLFDGVNDYVNFSTFTLDPTTNFAFSFWFKKNGYPIFGGASGEYVQAIGGNDKRVVITALGTFRFAANRNDTTWYHVFVTGSSSQAECYVNGVKSTNGPLPTSWSLQLEYLNKRLSDYTYSGVVDEIAVWTGVSGTAQNAIDLYNSGNGAYAYDVIPNPNRYYRLNGSGTDTTAIDEGSDGANGTLNNFPTSGMWVAH